jgi:hypothetical protein
MRRAEVVRREEKSCKYFTPLQICVVDDVTRKIFRGDKNIELRVAMTIEFFTNIVVYM